ncbi:MAG: hypothetical protein MJ223_02480 [Mycoplasmoidaceae bacterium]|nr:hypothetical protein [Mycoplasmoidaceae bacterium]
MFLLNKDELKGYGSGSNQNVARKALLHDGEVISRELVGTSLLFIIAGLGKGTGSGAAPELAKIAKDLGIITISIANLPSISSEGNQIYNQAFNSLQTLSTNSDCVSTISNDKILNVNPGISFYDIYHTANQKIVNIIQDIVKIIFAPGQINITLADLKTFFSTNQYFIGDRVELDMADLSQAKIEQTLAKQIDNSLTDIKTIGCKQAIINILLSKQAPPNIVNDIRIGFAKATKNDKIVLAVGVEYNDENKIKISYLLSGGNLEAGFEQITTINTEPTIKFEPVVDQSIEEYDQLMKQVTTASKSTQEILKENDQEIKIKEN